MKQAAHRVGDETMLSAALHHAAAGRMVFPCKPDKTPRTAHGFKDATADPGQITGWWTAHPDDLIGMPTGRVNGCFALDVDIDPATGKDGDASLAKILNGHGPLPDTIESMTPRGGRHLIFLHPGPGFDIPCSASKLGPDLDIRGDGGYIILPPSTLPDGRSYQWEGSSDPDEGVRAAAAPAWLLDSVVAKNGGKPSVQPTGDATGTQRIPQGMRDDTLFRLGRSLRAKAMSDAGILAALIAENAERCEPPLPEVDVRRIAASACTKPPGPSGGKPVVQATPAVGDPATLLAGAIAARIGGDAGACVTAEAEAAWRQIHATDRAEFLRLREQAKQAGARMAEIDAAVRWRAAPPAGAAQAQEARPAADWMNGLIMARGRNDDMYTPSRVENLRLILEHAPEFAGRLTWDEFAEKPMIDGQAFEDHHEHALCAALERGWIEGNVTSQHLSAAISLVQRGRSFHPVKRYLESCAWDGVPRVDMFFSYYMGLPHDAYHRGAARALFISAHKRIYEPGCKVDTMTILQGPQGKYKTELWLALFRPWAAEVTERIDGKDFQQALRGKWCMDFGELAQLSKAELEDVKRIMTSREDHYRPSYGRHTVTRPRTCIFVGGTNAQQFNPDHTGGRRWVPVQVKEKIQLDRVVRDRDQLWAEARMLAADAGNWWDIPDAEEHQENARIVDSWEDQVGSWLDGRHPGGYYAEKNGYELENGCPTGFSTATILSEALNIEVGRHGRPEQTRVGRILQSLGYHTCKVTIAGTQVRRYRKAAT